MFLLPRNEKYFNKVKSYMDEAKQELVQTWLTKAQHNLDDVTNPTVSATPRVLHPPKGIPSLYSRNFLQKILGLLLYLILFSSCTVAGLPGARKSEGGIRIQLVCILVEPLEFL